MTALLGRWRIVEMDLCADEDLHLVGPAFIEFTPGHTGSLMFIAVQGGIDWRETSRGDSPGLEYSWEGFDDSDPASGRGWARLEDNGSLRGIFSFVPLLHPSATSHTTTPQMSAHGRAARLRRACMLPLFLAR